MVDELARTYAELAVRVGVNLQAGQTLFVMGQPEHASLMRTVDGGRRRGHADGSSLPILRAGEWVLPEA
jgi:Thermophilic metalloprotease (M29)